MGSVNNRIYLVIYILYTSMEALDHCANLVFMTGSKQDTHIYSQIYAVSLNKWGMTEDSYNFDPWSIKMQENHLPFLY